MSNKQPGNGGVAGNGPGTPAGGELDQAQTAEQIAIKDAANPAPHLDQLREAIDDWRDAQDAETNAQVMADTDKAALETAQNNYKSSKKGLESAQLDTRQSKKDVDALLEEVTNESLEIIGQDDVTVFQGVSATFTAVSKYALDESLVYLFWETSGLPIIKGQYTATVMVDTASVGPGDYDINVSLRPVPKPGPKYYPVPTGAAIGASGPGSAAASTA
jgi:hypothetical protein